jgi:hypothetical protein
MFPTLNQHRKWSLPTKWTFWATVIGLPISLMSFLIGLPLWEASDPGRQQREMLVFRTTQELSYNFRWLSQIAQAYKLNNEAMPIGRMKVSGLIELLRQDYPKVIESEYGEGDKIYELSLLLKDAALTLNAVSKSSEVRAFSNRPDMTLHDVIFLNNFLWWYVAEMEVAGDGLYIPKPGDRFHVEGIDHLEMKHFVDEGGPLQNYGHWLGLLD